MDMSGFLIGVRVLPTEVDEAIESIASEAQEAAFRVIHERLAALGYTCTGDVAPDEAWRIDEYFFRLARSVTINNDVIAQMQTSKEIDEEFDDDGPGIDYGPTDAEAMREP